MHELSKPSTGGEEAGYFRKYRNVTHRMDTTSPPHVEANQKGVSLQQELRSSTGMQVGPHLLHPELFSGTLSAWVH